MLKISGPVGAAAFVSMFLLSGAGASLSIGSARADACLAAPKTTAPKGQHWYYHIERASRRKCWYLHAAVQLRHRAMIQHHSAAAAAANTEPAPEAQVAAAPAAAPGPSAPTPAAPVPMPDSTAGEAAPAPHVTVLAVRTSTPFVSATALPQQNTSEKRPPPPQTQLRDNATPAVDGVKPADIAAAAQPQGKTDAAYAAPAQRTDAAKDAVRTKTAEMFILLALVFGIAAALIAIVSKILGIYRRPRISDDPDSAWLSYRSARRRIGAKAAIDEQDVPFLDPQEHYGLADLPAQEWGDRSAPAPGEPSAPPHRDVDFTQAQTGSQSLKGIEPALRALRQARQSRVA